MTTPHAQTSSAPKQLIVRPYDVSDLEAILDLFNQPSCREGMATDPFTTVGDVSAWLDSQGPDALILVACESDVAIGVGVLVQGQDSRRYVGGVILFVHDAYHRRGVGTRLLRALMSTADAFRGMRRLELWVLCDNKPAIKIYSKFGFDIEGRHRCFAWRDGEMVDVYTMARVLPERHWNPKDLSNEERRAGVTTRRPPP